MAMDSNEFIERYADGHRDFSGELLEGLVLSRLLIQDLDLNGAILNNSEIVKTDIRGVDFRGSMLQNSRFYKTDISKCDFTGADLRGSNFNQVHLKKTIFDHANLSESSFTDALISRSSLRFTQLKRLLCCRLKLREVDLSQSVIDYSKLYIYEMYQVKAENLSAIDIELNDGISFDEIIEENGEVMSYVFEELLD